MAYRHLLCFLLPLFLSHLASVLGVMGRPWEVQDQRLRLISPKIRHHNTAYFETEAEVKYGDAPGVSDFLSGPPWHVHEPATVNLTIDAASRGWHVPDTLFGVFFEEINHAGAGGLDAELVQNRGFEAGGHQMPTTIDPWYPVGRFEDIAIQTELSSYFKENPVAVKLDVLCGQTSTSGEEILCPYGVGISNPGFWGMNFIAGEKYTAAFWIRASGSLVVTLSLTSFNGTMSYGHNEISINEGSALEWHKYEAELEALGNDSNGRLAVTVRHKRTVWLDQVSLKPLKTFKGHGMRKELAEMVAALKPGFIRFPGGCYVEGDRLANAFRWKSSVGPREERPGHFNGVWGYWSDDGLGLYEYLQFAEDINAKPVWVFNNGISHTDEVATWIIEPFVEDILDGIEFANGPSTSTWGSMRAKMGHPKPFNLEYVAVGNEDCGRYFYQDNYLKFYEAIKTKHPYMKIITNCDATAAPLQHPADLFDYHVYTSADRLFSQKDKFNSYPRDAVKAFVSEYAVVGGDAGRGSMLAAVAEAAFMTGLETNSDVIEMASYAPLFVNEHDRRWNPDAIVFNSWQQYGTPSYWVQYMFRRTGRPAYRLAFDIKESRNWAAGRVTASVTCSFCPDLQMDCIIVKAVNFARISVGLMVTLNGSQALNVQTKRSSGVQVSTMTAEHAMDENSFAKPDKIMPVTTVLENTSANFMELTLQPLSVNVLKFSVSEHAPAGTAWL